MNLVVPRGGPKPTNNLVEFAARDWRHRLHHYRSGMEITVPDYAGGSLVNLVAELEYRLSGSSRRRGCTRIWRTTSPRRAPMCCASSMGWDRGSSTILLPGRCLPRSGPASTAPFPATTTVSLSVLATGLPPSQHGLLGYQSWIPELEVVANTIHWTTLWGEKLDYPLESFLPAPNVAERLGAADVEVITIQPAHFLDSPLTKVLFRGSRFEGVYQPNEWVDAVVQLAAQPNRLIVAYLPYVDFAAHVEGQKSQLYTEAMQTVAGAWEAMCNRLPANAVAVGTADHGHVDFEKQFKIAKEDHEDRIFYGDGRAMFVKGDGASLAERIPATWVPLAEMIHWWGPEPRHPKLDARLPDGVLIADDDTLLLHRYSDDRMVGNHGALTDAERLIPLMVS